MILADKIIENRKKNGWSQEELAEKLGVSRQSVSKWEGAQAVPDMKKIIQLSELFGVSTDYLLKDEIEETDIAAQEYSDFMENEDMPIKVSVEEANKFLEYNERAAGPISLGVMLCIISAVPLLVLLGLSGAGKLPVSEYTGTMIGIIILLTLIACAVTVFIVTGMKGKPYDYLNEKNIDTEYGVSGMAKELRAKYSGTHTRMVVIGVVLCIVAAIPMFITMITGYTTSKMGGSLVIFGVALLLTMIGIGVKLLVKTSMINNGYNKLLEDGDYTRFNKRASKWDGIYWAIAVAIYLAWSFITMNWQMTWIVWPIAGVVFAAYKEIVKMILKSRR